MGKTRVGVLLRESVGGNKSTNKSADLVTQIQKYNEFVKQLKGMIDALKVYHANLAKMDASRSEVRTEYCVWMLFDLFVEFYIVDLTVFTPSTQPTNKSIIHSTNEQQIAKRFGKFCQKTPLDDAISLMPSADRPSSSVTSLASIYDDLSAKSKSYVTKYEQFVLSYILEWEKVIRGRIDAGIKKAEELRIELDHYQKK